VIDCPCLLPVCLMLCRSVQLRPPYRHDVFRGLPMWHPWGLQHPVLCTRPQHQCCRGSLLEGPAVSGVCLQQGGPGGVLQECRGSGIPYKRVGPVPEDLSHCQSHSGGTNGAGLPGVMQGSSRLDFSAGNFLAVTAQRLSHLPELPSNPAGLV